MKKIYSLLLIFALAFLLTACGGNKVEPHYEKIIFEFPEEFVEYLPYEEVPNFVLTFEGVLNTNVGGSLSNKKYFSKNDDFVFSDILENLLTEYDEKDRLTIRLFSQDEQFETRMNKLVEDKNGELKQESQIMKVKDGEVFNEIAFLNLENGLTLTIEYRRFVSDFEGEYKTYYSWRYVAPVNMVLHYPVMLHLNEKGEKEFLIVPLPTKVVYHLGVSTQLPLNKLLEKDDYFEDNFRRFYYPNFSNDPRDNEEFDRDENVRLVKDYYMRDFNAREENNKIIFSYLGYDFEVIFEEETFLINIL